MKTILQTLALLLLSANLVSAYKFLGPKWPGLAPEVSYAINEQGTPDVVNEFEAVNRAFDAWTTVEGTAITNKYLGRVSSKAIAPNHENLILWEEGNNFHYDKNVIAVCAYWYTGTAVPQTMTDFDITMNGRDFEWSTTGEAGKMDVQQIVQHEIGHGLGLAHSDDPGALMYMYSSRGDTSKRALPSDDSLGICKLYPRTTANNHAPKITSAPLTEAIAGEKYSYPVIATDEDGDTLKYRLTTFPLNMRIDSLTGVITWYPKFLDLGPHPVTVEVRDKFNAVARQSFTIKVGDLVVFTPDTVIEFGDTLYLPVYVTSMEGWNILAGNIELGFDPAFVTVLNVDTVGSVISGTTWARNITTADVKVAFAHSQAYTRSGLLFRVKLIVANEHCGETFQMTLNRAFFNDGVPVATTRNGKLFMKCNGSGYGYDIDGKVVHEYNRSGVGNARITLQGLDRKAMTNNDGFYKLPLVPRSSCNYLLAAVKDSGDVRSGLSAYDASLILRQVVQIVTFNTFLNQEKVADVNGNAIITAYDAALILRYLVKLDDGTRIGHWIITPSTKILPNLLEPAHEVNFDACMVGDVSGNWNDPNPEMPKLRSTDMTAVTLTSAADTFLCADSTEAAGYSMEVAYRNLSGLYSGEFEVAFDASAFTVNAIRSTELLAGFTLAQNVVGNRILVAFAGTQPIPAQGPLFTIELRSLSGAADAAAGTVTLAHARFNEMPESWILVENRAAERSRATASAINGVSPNPFNPAVRIDYSLKARGQAAIRVFDAAGREVVTLERGVKEPGVYSVTWNGKNQKGIHAAAGVYLLKFETPTQVMTRKLFLVK